MGQAHAIHKGFELATGELIAWLNSDDIYLPGALNEVGITYALAGGTIIAGQGYRLEPSGESKLVLQTSLAFEKLIRFWTHDISWHQPGVFWPRATYFQIGGLNQNLDLAMDYDLFLRMLKANPVTYIDFPLARFRIHADAKTFEVTEHYCREISEVSRRYWQDIDPDEEKWMKRIMAMTLIQTAEIYLRQGKFKRGLQCLGGTADLCGIEIFYALVVGSRRRLNRAMSGYPPKGSNVTS